MLGLTSLELRLSLYGIILVGIAGFLFYERHEGATSVVRADNQAELLQTQKDRDDARHTIESLQQQLASIPSTSPDASPMRLCYTKYRVSPGPPSNGTRPQTPPDSGSDRGVQAGTQPGIDIGGPMQDITLAGVLATTYAQNLWQLAVEESKK